MQSDETFKINDEESPAIAGRVINEKIINASTCNDRAVINLNIENADRINPI
jgi:hypothetical protein